MKKLSPAEYIAEMKQIEGRRNAACRLGDRRTVEESLARCADLNRRFFGRIQG